MSGLSGKPDAMWFPGKFWEANTVADFWSKWNPAFHKIYLLLLRWLRRRAGTPTVILPTVFSIFIFNGLQYDGLFWLANFGKKNFQYSWTIFFLMNAMVVVVERYTNLQIFLPTIVKKFLTFSWLIGSLILAFIINDLLH